MPSNRLARRRGKLYLDARLAVELASDHQRAEAELHLWSHPDFAAPVTQSDGLARNWVFGVSLRIVGYPQVFQLASHTENADYGFIVQNSPNVFLKGFRFWQASQFRDDACM